MLLLQPPKAALNATCIELLLHGAKLQELLQIGAKTRHFVNVTTTYYYTTTTTTVSNSPFSILPVPNSQEMKQDDGASGLAEGRV